MPMNRNISNYKEYCDLLYAWLQVHSGGSPDTWNEARIVDKNLINWSAIERAFTVNIEGKEEKRMGRKLIARNFKWLEDQGLVKFDPENDVYLLPKQAAGDAFLVEYNTLAKLTNVLQKRSISVYVYILNRYIANYYNSYFVKLSQIKDFIGITANTSANNIFIVDTFDILKRLGLMDFELQRLDNDRTMYNILWVSNVLPETK